MDLATIIGLVLAYGLVIVAMLLGGSIIIFIDVPSALIVFGGTLAVTLMAAPLSEVIGAVKVAMNTVFDKAPDAAATSVRLQELAGKVRKEGILALENEDIADKFLGKGVRLAVDGVPGETIRVALQSEMAAMKKRHAGGQALFSYMASMGPAMGMIGTLIGLVQMLQNLSDPSSIGPSMAVAMLTTMYGAILANMLCTPIATKLENRTAVEAVNMVVVIEGIDAIVKGENAMIIREKLEAYLSPAQKVAQEG